MTFLRGTTTVGALAQKINQLICGEVPDDAATTCATGDRWVREITRTVTDGVLNATTTVTSATAAFTNADVGANVIGTGVPAGATIASVTNATTVVLSAAATASASGVSLQICHDTIRTPAAKDVNTGNCSMRTCYFNAVGSAGTTMATGATTVCRVTNPFTSDPSTSGFHRWVVSINTVQSNTVPGNYSNAVITVRYTDADTGVNLYYSSNVTISAAGVYTAPNGLQITLSDPSGTIPTQVMFVRGFTSTYMYGIDWWPMYYRASGTPTFTVSPPGVAGTDYDVLSNQVPAATTAWQQSGTPTMYDRMSQWVGLGIKTATGAAMATNPLYTLSFPMALAKGRIFLFNNGTLGLDVGQSRTDLVNPGTGPRAVGGIRNQTWLKFATTPGTMVAATQVQYWLSVKNDGIALALNADPGNTGKMGNAYWGTLSNIVEPTYDVLPIFYSAQANDYTADNTNNAAWWLATQYSYLALKRRQDGSEAPRDWQTRWMRSDGYAPGVGYSGSSFSDMPNGQMAQSAASTLHLAVAPQGASSQSYAVGPYPPRQNKPASDGKWWLYPINLVETDWSTYTQDENRTIRGTLTRWLFAPGDQWGNGDELTDTSTSTKYLLLLPDYVGVGARLRASTNQFYGGPVMVEL